ncbi:TonB-dependent receptor plug domain-containing protein [Chryseobacterium sp. 1B4]
MKTIQLLPGIKSNGEGSSGFSVRGGATDQNLILLDEAPVYNASHLLGFSAHSTVMLLKMPALLRETVLPNMEAVFLLYWMSK